MGRGRNQVSIWVSKPVINGLGGLAILFGIISLISGRNALFVLHRIADSTAHIVPFVLYFNFSAGFVYIVAGVGLVLQRSWAPLFAAAIAASTVIVFAALGIWIAIGNAYEAQTIAAMSLRTVFWLGVTAVSIIERQSLAVLSQQRSNQPVDHPVPGGRTHTPLANDNQTPHE